MRPFTVLLMITVLESAVTVLIERGIFFFTEDQLGFTKWQNLALALAFATPYVIAALSSHRLCVRYSEKRVTLVAIVMQAVMLAFVAMKPSTVTVFVANASLGCLTGLKWPPIESYVSAGLTPAQTAKRIGVFNVAWASMVPVSVAITGPLIALWDRALFVLPIALSLVSAVLTLKLATRPTHLPDDHPERPTGVHMTRIRALLLSSRWLMLGNYALWFVAAAVMPNIFKELGYTVRVATLLAALLDSCRVLAFLFMQRFEGWHFKISPLIATALLMPVGAVLLLAGVDTPTVLLGEVLFGASAGLTYYAALYYAMVVKNAAVDAGGVHEGLIGMGFVIGPIAGLVGERIAVAAAMSTFAGLLVGVGPLMAICLAGGLWPLWRLRRKK